MLTESPCVVQEPTHMSRRSGIYHQSDALEDPASSAFLRAAAAKHRRQLPRAYIILLIDIAEQVPRPHELCICMPESAVPTTTRPASLGL